jgi:hypothetical protein
MLSTKPTGVGGWSERQLRFKAVEAKAFAVSGGIQLSDNLEAEDNDDLDENALVDALEEVDGIETARVSVTL